MDEGIGMDTFSFGATDGFGQAQDLQNKSVLASQYYQSKEYGKAAELYEELYTATKSEGYFSIYLDCLWPSRIMIARREPSKKE